MSYFADAEFRDIAVRLGYMDAAELEECVKIQNRTVGRTVKSLEQIALDGGFVNEKDLGSMMKGRPAEAEPLEIPGYEIKSILGEGGLGTVYRAVQTNMMRDVALKVLHPRWVSDDEFRKRFLLEARLVGKMSHRNLIQVFDVGQHQGFYYFSMEYVDGPNVHQELKAGAFEPNRAIDIAIQMADAVKYIKGFDLVHRDIKPSNILLTMQGIAKLGDFGFVKSGLDKHLSKADYVLGTPDYISPEQAVGDEVDWRSDIYSLGATFYHMLTGALPFDGSESTVIRSHIRAELPSPRQIRRDLTEDLCQVIEKMMAKSREDRYQDIEELINDLRLVKTGQHPATAALEAGKSTILKALDHKTKRTRQLQEERNLLRKRIEDLEKRIQILLAIVGFLSFLVVGGGLVLLFLRLLRG
ncbi:MAG: serine/threonine protein kinase [Planctomycetes bacterium]|nr:serine/threonine protein kinase [Planctomycetota bacterium]